jgi:hypothetical protein
VESVVDTEARSQVLSEYFGFSCHSFIPLIAPQSSPSILQGWYNRQIIGRSNNGLHSIPAPYIEEKINGFLFMRRLFQHLQPNA